jgi:hypothetical protein
MDTVISDYAVAVKEYVALSQQETIVKIQVQQARQKLLMAKQEMRATEQELLELK